MDLQEIAILGAFSGFVITYVLNYYKIKQKTIKKIDVPLSAIFACLVLYIFKDKGADIKEYALAAGSSIFNNILLKEDSIQSKNPIINILKSVISKNTDKEQTKNTETKEEKEKQE